MLKPKLIVVQFARRVSDLMRAENVQVRRAFPQLMSMIQASALLHQAQRKLDIEGRLYASADDYQIARRLLQKPMARQLGGGLSDQACRFLERLKKWAVGEFTSTEAKGKETGCKSSVHGWLNDLNEAGFLQQVEVGRGRTPAKWQLTGKTLDDTEISILPSVEQVFGETNGEMLDESPWNHGDKSQLVEAQ
jgi:hypothetical protein